MFTRFEPDAAGTYEQLVELMREHHAREIFSEDGSSVDDQVARLLAGQRIATAESCTAGLLSARSGGSAKTPPAAGSRSGSFATTCAKAPR